MHYTQHAIRLSVSNDAQVLIGDAPHAIKLPGSPSNWTEPGLADGVLFKNAVMKLPTDIAVMPVERAGFLCEWHRIRYLDFHLGKMYTLAGGSKQGFMSADNLLARNLLLSKPGGIAIRRVTQRFLWGEDYDDKERFPWEIYVTETPNHWIRVIRFDEEKWGVKDAAGYFNMTSYFVDTGESRIVVGTGTAGYSGDGQLALMATVDSPRGVTIDHQDVLWFADDRNNRIRIVYISHKAPLLRRDRIYTAAGDGVAAYAGDGLSSPLASLKRPTHVKVTFQDPEVFDAGGDTDPLQRGEVYIADTGNQMLRRFTMQHGECGRKGSPICGTMETVVGMVGGFARRWRLWWEW